MSKPVKVAFLEPYYGGSHAYFADTLIAHSRHEYVLATLPAQKWKWRMRSAAIWLARDAGRWIEDEPDIILCSDMLSVADLRALLPEQARHIPIVCYFHENQLSYPIPEEDQRDYQYGFTNITSCLAADEVWFNSEYHRRTFFAAAERLMARMPDYVPQDVTLYLESRSRVLYPPVALDSCVTEPTSPAPRGPLTILWCHRWEYDKNPELFFTTLAKLHDEGRAFRVVLTGRRFRDVPAAFEAIGRLGEHVTHAGYLEDRAEYLRQISRCDLVVSTAIQENFGIAVIEAVLAGCCPLLPNRLAYPEVVPAGFHSMCLFDSDSQFYDSLAGWLDGSRRLRPDQWQDLSLSQRNRFGADVAVAAIDDAIDEVVSRAGSVSAGC